MTKINSNHESLQSALITTNENKFQQICEVAKKQYQLTHISLGRVSFSRGNFITISSCGNSALSTFVENFTVSALGHPNLGRLTVGSSYEIDEETKEKIEFLCTQISKEFQTDWLTNLMRKLATPIPWHDDPSIYLSKLAQICREAAGAAHIAIREDTKKKLEATAWNSHDPNLDFSGIKGIPSSSKVGKIICPPRENDRVFFHGPNSELVLYMKEKLAYNFIHVIISMPIIVQGKRIGAINFAYDQNFNFSKTFREGLELLSNVIGTALNNYRLRTVIEANVRKIFWSGRQALNYELMQGYRHWARSSVFELDEGLDHLCEIVDNSVLADNTGIIRKNVENAREELHKALSSMEDLTSTYKLDKKDISLIKIFNKCCSLLSFELTKEQIRIHHSSVNDSLMGNEDSMRAVFLNLILNSIQAFRENKQTRGNITLAVSTDREKVNFTYSDDGPGIKLGPILNRPDEVWLPEKSTKPNGTGFGMPMIRQVIQTMHGGEIHLNNTKRKHGFSVTGFVLRDGFNENHWGK